MTVSFRFGRADNGGPDTVTPAGTTQLTATALTGQVNLCASAAGTTGVVLPYRAQMGSPIVVVNTASTATALSVYPPLVSGAAGGGKIYGTSTSVSADAAFSIAQGKSATFWPHANGIDYTGVLGG